MFQIVICLSNVGVLNQLFLLDNVLEGPFANCCSNTCCVCVYCSDGAGMVMQKRRQTLQMEVKKTS